MSMLSRCKCIFNKSAAIENIIDSFARPENVRIIRWRKRRWAPVNPSKLYYVRERGAIDPEEKAEFRWRMNQYRTQLRSLKQFIRGHLAARQESEHDESHMMQEKAFHDSTVQMNDAWNQESMALRKAREAEASILEEQKKSLLLEKLAKEEEERKARVLAMLEKEQAEAKNFVDLENLDAEIERALDKRVSYNFAIDIDGNRYVEKPDGSVIKKEKSEETAFSEMRS